MPQLRPIAAVTYATSGDQSPHIAPPYDVLDETSKAALLERDPHNIVAVDLPHLPPKTVGPDATYEAAGAMWRQWLDQGVLKRHERPALFVYQQTYTDPRSGKSFKRRGLFANLRIQPFGVAQDDTGVIHPHEQTFSAPKEDRLKLMRATRTQLSPIFGLYSDPDDHVGPLLAAVIDAGEPTYFGATATDGVEHALWMVNDVQAIEPFVQAIQPRDIFIADGHHRYNTALTYKAELEQQAGGPLSDGHGGNWCMFVLVAMQDPGMIVLPTHRVLGGMTGFSVARLIEASEGRLKVEPFTGGLAGLEKALEGRGPHAMGLYCPAEPSPLAIVTTREADPLAKTHADRSEAWRQLDVAVLQHLIVEQVCEPAFCPDGAKVAWKFPHTLEQVERDVRLDDYQVAFIMQPTPLDSVRRVSEAGELMPQKSTFFYPKLVTGMVMNGLE